MSTPPTQQSFGDLFIANAKVLLGGAIFLAVAFFVWRGIAALFPDVAWLQGPLG